MRGPTPQHLRAQLHHDLPVGTPRAKVDAYLTAHGWMHDYLPKENACLAGVRDVGSRFTFTREDIAVRINFDGNHRVKSMTVTPFYSYHGR